MRGDVEHGTDLSEGLSDCEVDAIACSDTCSVASESRRWRISSPKLVTGLVLALPDCRTGWPGLGEFESCWKKGSEELLSAVRQLLYLQDFQHAIPAEHGDGEILISLAFHPDAV